MIRRLRQPRGISFVELLVTISIAVVLGGIIMSLNLEQIRSYRLGSQRSEIESSTRLAIRRVVKSIRDAQPSATGGFAIVQANPQTLIFYANIDGDPGIERVRFFLNGANLQRGYIEPVGTPATYPSGTEVVSTVAPNVRNGASPVFEYFDKNYLGSGPPLSQPVTLTDIRLVRVTLSVDNDLNQPPQASTLTTDVQLRNLKDNY